MLLDPILRSHSKQPTVWLDETIEEDAPEPGCWARELSVPCPADLPAGLAALTVPAPKIDRTSTEADTKPANLRQVLTRRFPTVARIGSPSFRSTPDRNRCISRT